jgi:hypothetical protein
LRSYGFRTFDGVWDESYDTIIDDAKRIAYLSRLLKHLDNQSESEKNKIFKKCIPIIEHNWNHFYNGAFEKVLWTELIGMLNNLRLATQGDLSSN